MGMNYLMQMLLACFALLLAFPLAKSRTLTTTSKEEVVCYTCTPIQTPPPPVINCPPPPSPPSPPPPSPPPPTPSPPPPGCPSCPPCDACEVPNAPAVPGPPRPIPLNQQPGVMGGAVYPPPNEAVPYFPYGFQNPPPSYSAASSTHLELKPVVSIIILLLSATFSFF